MAVVGKRGPKKGEGGRPIQFDDELHRYWREQKRKEEAERREVQKIIFPEQQRKRRK